MKYLPTPWTLADLWSRLLDLPVRVSKAAPLPLLPDSPYALGVYGDRRSPDVALAVVEPSLAAYVSAALPRIPLSVAKEAVERGRLPPSLMENFQEVMNVTSQILHVPRVTESPITLANAYQNSSRECRPLMLAMRSTSAASWHVTVQGYEGGNIMFVDLEPT